MPFAPRILDINTPQVEPQGAPQNDYERINATPEMFGAGIGRSEEKLGQGFEQLGSDATVAQLETQRMQDQIHASELHSWFSDQAGNEFSKFSQLQGRASIDALPALKQKIAGMQQDAANQAGNLFTKQLVSQNTRYTMDWLYRMATNHADSQRTQWSTTTAKNNIDTAINMGGLAVTNGTDFDQLDHQMDMVNREAHNYYDPLGYDPDTLADAVSKFRGDALKNWVGTAATNDKDPDALTHALQIYHRYSDQIDPVSRLTISKELNTRTFNRTVDRLANYYTTGQVAGIDGSFVNVIKNQFEGFDKVPRWDFKQWTVGYGTKASGPNERPDRFELEGRFEDELTKAANFVDSVNPKLDPGTRAALTSLTFNAGEKWASSGLGDAIRNNDLLHAQQLFLQYDRAGGAVNPALERRRTQEAQWFGQNSAPGGAPDPAALIERVQTDPAFANRPELQKAVENNILAKSAMAARANALTERANKDASDAAELNFFQNIHSGKPTVTLDQIINDPNMTREAKERMSLQLETATGEKKDNTYGSGFYDLYRRVHAPDGDPQKISDPSVLYSHVGPNGDLTVAGVDKLVQEIQAKKTPDGEAEAAMKNQFLKNARAQITGTDEGLHIKDPKGDELYLKFLAKVLPEYDKEKREGKSPAALLNPDSADYLGGYITGFKRPSTQWFSDVMNDQKTSGAFDMASIKTLDDATAAYMAGHITRDQAQMIVGQHPEWGVTFSQPSPQVPFRAQ